MTMLNGLVWDATSGWYSAEVIDVLTLRGSRISAVTAFGPADILPRFGLPLDLPADAEVDYDQPVVRRRYRCAASGTNTIRIAKDQAIAAMIGCSIGHTWMDADGFGLPNSVRAAAVTALTGFQLAIVCSHAGIPCVGTIALDTIASGKKMTSPMPCADSGPFDTIPRHAQAHESA